jgi:nicotinamidase-related amidase
MTGMQAVFNPADVTTPGAYQPCQTVLLLLDFHSLFVEKAGGPNAPAALATAAKLRIWAKSHGIVVVHALIDIEQAPYSTCKGTERVSSLLTAMKTNYEEPEDLRQDYDNGDFTLTRAPGHVSALRSPGLPGFLLEKGIKSLILTGLSTSGCVLRTAVPATDEEYVVTIISDACADPDQGIHDMLTQKLLLSRAYVTTAAEFQEGYIPLIGC